MKQLFQDLSCGYQHYLQNPGFVNSTNIVYNNVLFSWFDKDGETASYYPFSCRGVFVIGAYSDRENIQFGGHFKDSFIFDMENLKICFVVRKTYLPKFNSRLDILNGLRSSFGIENNLKVETLSDTEYQFPPNSDDFAFLRLTGDVIWQSSAPMISFLTGMLKYIESDAFSFIKNLPPFTFMKTYKETPLFTSNIDLIRQEFNRNLDKEFESGATHDYGACSLLNQSSKYHSYH